MRLVHALVLLFLLLAPGATGMGTILYAQSADPARPAPVLTLTDAKSDYSVAPYLEILRDPTRELTFRDITTSGISNRFIPNTQATPNLGITGDAVWLRWRVRNDSATTEWRVALREPRLSYVAFYRPAPNSPDYIEKVVGRDFSFTARELPYREFVFRTALPRGSEQTFYVQLRSTTPLIFPLTLSTVETLAQQEQQTLLFFGLFYGAMLIMAGYNLFLFFSLRDANYLYLALFIVTYSVSSAARVGLAQQYLWPALPEPFFVQLITALVLVFQIKFTTGILDTHARVPKLHRLFEGLVIACLIVGALSVFVRVNVLVNLLTALTVTSEGLAAFVVWRQGYRAARLYLVSWALLLASALAFGFSNLNLLAAVFIPETIIMVATAVGALFWSLAIADRVNLLQAETESANRQLTIANRRLERSERKYRALFENSRDAIFMTTREGKVVDLNPAGVELFGVEPSKLDEFNARDVYAEAAERARALEAIEAQGFVQDYPVRLRRQDGSEMNALITSSIWQDEESNQVGYQGIVRDVTERLRTEAELEQHREHLEELVQIRTAQAAVELAERRRVQEALQRRVGELSTLNEIAVTVSAVRDTHATLQDVADMAAELFAAQAVMIVTLDRERALVKLLALVSRPPLAEPFAEQSYELDDVPAFRQVIDQSKPLMIDAAQNGVLLGGMRELSESIGTQTALLAPLRVHGDIVGVLTISSNDAGHAFGAEEMNLVETVASAIATALENMRLYQEARVIAVAQERQRMARELHDSVVQTLYSTVLMASGWRMLAEQGRLDARDAAFHFQQLAEQSEQALKEMRLLLFQLRPLVLEQVGLVGALQQRLDAVERRVSIETMLVTNGAWDDLPPRVEAELYNIAQEALNNALRHAHAKAIRVRLERRERCAELSVEDDGIGFDPAASFGGMGLVNMQERAREIGAEFSLTSLPQHGSKIHVRVDLGGNSDE